MLDTQREAAEAAPVLDYAGCGALSALPANNRILTLIPRLRWLYFTLAALFLVLAFNGKWRIGRDSAAYRGIAHHLATTGKYQFRDTRAGVYREQHDTRYPGLPLMLAGLEKAFGSGAAPAITMIALTAFATLLVTYRVTKSALPLWLAVAVTFGVGINGRFLQHSHEILSDVPFLLGVMVTLLAFDHLERARTTRARITTLALLVAALLLSAALRPTFWILALSLLATCVWGLFRPTHSGQRADEARPRRIACGLTLAVLAIASLVFFLFVDLRGSNGQRGAGYERKLFNRLLDFDNKIIARLPLNAHELLEQSLPEAFFGTQLGPGIIPLGANRWIGLSTVLSLVLIISTILLVRRNVLWGVFVAITFGTMLALGSVPRYFVMILPLLLAGWGMHVFWLSEKTRRFGMQEIVTVVLLGLVILPNLIHCADLVREQRGFNRKGKNVGFLKSYDHGSWAGIYDMAAMLKKHVPADQPVIGPEATVLTYLSDRSVYGLGMFLPRKEKGTWVAKMRELQTRPNQGFKYAIFPDTDHELYDDKDLVTGRLIKARVLQPTRVIDKAGGHLLAEYKVVPVVKKKKGKPPAATAPATQPRAKKKRRPTTTQATTTKPATAPATTQSTRRKRRPATTQSAVTRPATQATTKPATQPTRRRRGRATTRPTTLPTTRPSALHFELFRPPSLRELASSRKGTQTTLRLLIGDGDFKSPTQVNIGDLPLDNIAAATIMITTMIDVF